MTDTSTTEPPETPPLPEGITKAEVEEHLAQVRREMEEFKGQSLETLSAQERKELADLKVELAELKVWKSEVEKREKERNDSAEDKETRVIPPSTWPRPSPHNRRHQRNLNMPGNTPRENGGEDGSERGRSRE